MIPPPMTVVEGVGDSRPRWPMLARLKGSIPEHGDVVITVDAIVGPVSPVQHGHLSRPPSGRSVVVHGRKRPSVLSATYRRYV